MRRGLLRALAVASVMAAPFSVTSADTTTPGSYEPALRESVTFWIGTAHRRASRGSNQSRTPNIRCAPCFLGVQISMFITWDEAKRERNLRPEPEGHGLDFTDARDRFDFAAAVVLPSYPGRDGAPRFLAVGWLDNRLVSLVFSPLGTQALSIISLRPASRKERRIHDQA